LDLKMRSWIAGLLLAAAATFLPAQGMASSLQITPVNIEVPAPGAASKVTLANSGDEQLNAQIRVFKWVQKNGKDELVETRDVVASPPAVKLGPGKKTVIRVVRVSKTPAATEESYRLIVDEVPTKPKPGAAGVGFAIRYSVPVFFSKPGEDSDLNWSASMQNGQLVLKAQNAGGRRVRLAALKVTGGSGKAVSFGNGLSGYVLGQSSRVWVAKSKSIAPGNTVKIVAQGDNGPIEATAKVQAAN
jgi:fimbrial chaperone protein